MKYLVLLAVLVVAYLVWRNGRERGLREAAQHRAGPAPTRAPALPQDMVRCSVCSLHLPRPDAVPGTSGRLYCSHEHRAAGGN